MFSASLISMMVHSLPPAARQAFHETDDNFQSGNDTRTIPTPADIAKRFDRAINAETSIDWPFIPVVARTHKERLIKLLSSISPNDPTYDPSGFLWGRIRLNRLIAYYLGNNTTEIHWEHLDLGTPVRAAGSTTSTPSGQSCEMFLTRTPSQGNGTVGAAIVDLGISSATGAFGQLPRNYNNKLRHVPYPRSASVDLSPHAENVLEVLLERLSTTAAPGSTTLKMLDITAVSMALVIDPTPQQIRGLDCFKQHCAPELLIAVQQIARLLKAEKIPAVVNMSVGTHVGPHNGHSPLEAYISSTLFIPSHRFAFAAAGNEGTKGISARLELQQDAADYMEMVVDRDCTELLVEFWWDDAIPAGLEIMASIEGSGFTPHTVAITPATAVGVTLQPAGTSTPMSFLSLFHTKTHGTMSCIAFAATRPPASQGGSLQGFRICFDLTATTARVAVHAWLVICEKGLRTHFTQGGPWATVSAPASDPNVVSVAGFDPASKQMWRYSSRGPASWYTNQLTLSPSMAHLCDPGAAGPAGHGTSYASPRAAADATAVLADPNRIGNATNVASLIEQTYGINVGPWHPRYGFHQQTT